MLRLKFLEKVIGKAIKDSSVSMINFTFKSTLVKYKSSKENRRKISRYSGLHFFSVMEKLNPLSGYEERVYMTLTDPEESYKLIF